MWAARALLFASCLPASTALSLQQPEKAPRSLSQPGSLQDPGKIPKYIWVTGQWKSDSAEVEDQMGKNIGDQSMEKKTNQVQAQVQAYYAKWAPIGSHIRYLTDEDMDDTVRNISAMLAERGIKDVAKGYFNLRPGAFRADVWRLMQLWAEGGVYLDANINLTCSLNVWIDFSNDELVLVTDTGVRDGIWNAMMAAEPRNQYIESAIAHISRQVLAHYYGSNPLSITGPIALGASLRKHQGYPQGLRSVLQWKGGNVSNKITGAVVARKDEKLHPKDASIHYDPMWRHHQVYCDQKGPVPDHGKCPTTTTPGSTPAAATTPAAPPTPAQAATKVSQCSTKFGINFCNSWCNTPGYWPCGTSLLDGPDVRNTDNVDYTCSCSGCNGCPSEPTA